MDTVVKVFIIGLMIVVIALVGMTIASQLEFYSAIDNCPKEDKQ